MDHGSTKAKKVKTIGTYVERERGQYGTGKERYYNDAGTRNSHDGFVAFVLQVHTTLKRADHFASFYKEHGSFDA